MLFAVPNTGEVERLADIFTEYNVSFRLGSRTRGGESYADETSLLRRRSAHHDAGEGLCARWRDASRKRTSPSSARAICSTNPMRWPRGRSGRSPKFRRFFLISAICRSAITWCTSSTASGSTRA